MLLGLAGKCFKFKSYLTSLKHLLFKINPQKRQLKPAALFYSPAPDGHGSHLAHQRTRGEPLEHGASTSEYVG